MNSSEHSRVCAELRSQIKIQRFKMLERQKEQLFIKGVVPLTHIEIVSKSR